MGHLRPMFLGRPEVYDSGQALKFPTRKALALLIYLAVEGGRHSREKLTALFWPESDATRGRAALRNTLAYLRSALRQAADVEPGGETTQQLPLIVERDALGFNFNSDFELDLHTLEAVLQAIQAPAVSDRRLLAQLRAAADLYRGDFLEGFTLPDAPDFDTWASIQREYWHHCMTQVCDQLSQLLAKEGRISQAMDAVTRWLTLDPLNEDAYRRLMALHFTAGDRDAALRAYEACRAMLSRELNAEPTPETQALAERIRSQAAPPSRPGISSLPPTFLEAPFVGRAPEYFKLIEVYHTAHSRQTQVVALVGEAGIGKTRLATEFLGWATAQGADVLQGQAFETGGRLPYQPLVQALRTRVERENAPEDLLSDVWLAELSRLLPELRDRYPDLPPATTDEATARTRLFEAVARLGRALAERASLVLFIDDLQWADAASLDLLHYLGGRWASSESGAPVLLLLSLRTDALVTTPPLADWLTGLERDLPLTRLMLRPLTAENTLQLVQSLAGVEHGSRGAEEQGSDWHSGDFSPAPLAPPHFCICSVALRRDPRPAFLHHGNPQGTDRTRLAARTGYAGRGVDARLRSSDGR